MASRRASKRDRAIAKVKPIISAKSPSMALSNVKTLPPPRPAAHPHQGAAPSHPDGGLRNGAARRAVDMMDNARALPTCPQPQQQQQTDFLAA